jgi:acyl dehydratase
MTPTAAAWAVGDALPELRLPPVTRLDLIRYAGASGDYNPIHTIDEEAARAGLPGVIQHGMLTMARMGTLFSPYFDRGFLRRFRVRFTGMVFVGDTLAVGGVVTKHERVPGGGDAYTFDVYAKAADGRSVASGTVELVLDGVATNQRERM